MPFWSTTKFGSIALYWLPVVDEYTWPWSVHVPGSIVDDVASPIADTCVPKVDMQ